MSFKLASISVAVVVLLSTPLHSNAQAYDDIDPDVFDYCQDRAERRSGYVGAKPDQSVESGVLKGALGGAVLGGIFSDDTEDVVAGAVIGGVFGGIQRERAKDKQARLRILYQYEFDACIERRR